MSARATSKDISRRWQGRIVSRAAKRQAQRWSSQLKLKPHVRYVGIGYKFKGGKITDEISVIAYVSEKKSMSYFNEVPKRMKIRTWVRTDAYITTDVVEISYRPRISGASSGTELTAAPTRGTCAVCWANGEGAYVVTNDHVVRNLRTGQDRPQIVVVSNGTAYAGRVIRSTLVSASGRNRHDSAVIIFSPRMPVEFWSVGGRRLTNIGKIGLGNTYAYYADGGTLIARAISRVDDDVAFEVAGAPTLVTYNGFWILQMVSGLTKEGHSGALLHRLLPGGLLGAGLVFARLEERNWAYALDANEEWKALGIG